MNPTTMFGVNKWPLTKRRGQLGLLLAVVVVILALALVAILFFEFGSLLGSPTISGWGTTVVIGIFLIVAIVLAFFLLSRR